jgi:hypothetical protein
MPATTTTEAVQKIIQYDSDVINDVPSFITTAGLLVDSVIGDAISSTQQEIVCRYLAAHLIAITDNSTRIQSEQVKTIQQSYSNRLSDGLGITMWGTMAMQLDTSGKLAAHNQRVVKGIGKWSLMWGGKEGDPDVAY